MSTDAGLLIKDFIKGYWITMRPYLLFVSGITGISGLSFAETAYIHHTIFLFAAFFFSYGFGQALTDCFQMDTDSLSSPYRPLVQGILRRNDVLLVSILGLALCGTILGLFSFINLILAFFCVLGLVSYTYFKRRWWGGPFYNSWIVVLVFVMGYVSEIANSKVELTGQLLAAMLTVFFGYANFVLTGYFKDVAADRVTGYNTIVVVYGRKLSALVSDAFSLLFVGSGVSSCFLTLSHHVVDISFVAAVLSLSTAIYLTAYSQVTLHKNTDDQSAYQAIIPCVHSYFLMLSAITVTNKPSWIFGILVFYILFLYSIFSRPVQSQI